MNYGKSIFDSVSASMREQEIKNLREQYKFKETVFKRIHTYYTMLPTKIGNVKKTISFLESLLAEYGFDKTVFEKFVENYPDIILAHPVEIERKLIVLNSVGLAEEILFRHPGQLSDNNQLDALSMYAAIKDLLDSGEIVDFETLYGSFYTNDRIEQLRKKYPLTLRKYDLLKERYSKSRELKKEKEYIKTVDNGRSLKFVINSKKSSEN